MFIEIFGIPNNEQDFDESDSPNISPLSKQVSEPNIIPING